MDSIRVHLGPMPPMLRSMIHDMVSAEEDMKVVGHGDATTGALPAARAEGANVIIVTDAEVDGDPSLRAVMRGGPLTILLLSPAGETCTAVTLSHRELALEQMSMTSIAEVLRAFAT